MSSDGYNHFLVNPSGLVVGGPPASTPAAAPESAIQRLLGGAPELLDRISEQAAHMSFQDPLNIYFTDMHKLYDNHHELLDHDSFSPWKSKQLKASVCYDCMLENIAENLWKFSSHIINRMIPSHENIAPRVNQLRYIINRIIKDDSDHFEDFKSYNHLYDQWKALRAQMVGLLEDNRMSDARITGNWIIKNIDDTFTSMRELLLSMAPAKGQQNPRAPLTQKYVGKHDLTKRILEGKP